MKASEAFGLAVRIVGFLIVVYGLWNFWAGVESIPESFLQKVGGSAPSEDSVSIFSYFALGIPAMGFGAFCLFCADWMTRLVYRKP
jgi:hypothetical protein